MHGAVYCHGAGYAYGCGKCGITCSDQEKVRDVLESHNADFKGVDHQIDTYFKVPNGRLRLREGNIENYLIFYEREDKEGQSNHK